MLRCISRDTLKMFIGLAALGLALTNCNNTEQPPRVEEPPKPFPVIPFCTRLPRVKITGREPALAPNYKLQWPQHTVLYVYLMEGNPQMSKKLLQVANTWSRFANISFAPTDKIYLSQVRVTFRKGGYASAVGRESKEQTYANVASMFLEGLDTLRDENEFRRIVLHEFGHALGLEHELLKSSAHIPWDSNAVYKYYSDHYKWDRGKVDQNVFRAFDVPKPYDEFDSSSIMIYAVPDTLTIGRSYQIPWPKQLSLTDQECISTWYPKS